MAVITTAQSYVQLTPLDTTALPNIAVHTSRGTVVSAVLERKSSWEHIRKRLVRKQFSVKCVGQMMRTLNHQTRDVVSIPCVYWSETPSGDSLLVSGMVYLPNQRTLKGIVIANHYTIGSDAESPSRSVAMEKLFAMKGYAVIMPDYVGYGVSSHMIHPYLHWRSAAQTAVDLLECMPELLHYYGYSCPSSVIVEGYSQGAAVAVGVVRLLEEYKESLSYPIEEVYLYAGAGPYDPAATYDVCLETDTMGIPAAIPMIVIGLNDSYSLELPIKDMFLEPLASNYLDWVGSKQYSITQIGKMIGTKCVRKILSPIALDTTQMATQRLYSALQANSHIGSSIPCRAYFFHSTEDDMVPIVNSTKLAAAMPESGNVLYDFGEYGSHMEASLRFMQYVYQDL